MTFSKTLAAELQHLLASTEEEGVEKTPQPEPGAPQTKTPQTPQKPGNRYQTLHTWEGVVYKAPKTKTLVHPGTGQTYGQAGIKMRLSEKIPTDPALTSVTTWFNRHYFSGQETGQWYIGRAELVEKTRYDGQVFTLLVYHGGQKIGRTKSEAIKTLRTSLGISEVRQIKLKPERRELKAEQYRILSCSSPLNQIIEVQTSTDEV